MRQRAPTCRAAQEAGSWCVVLCGGRGLAVRSVVLQLRFLDRRPGAWRLALQISEASCRSWRTGALMALLRRCRGDSQHLWTIGQDRQRADGADTASREPRAPWWRRGCSGRETRIFPRIVESWNAFLCGLLLDNVHIFPYRVSVHRDLHRSLESRFSNTATEAHFHALSLCGAAPVRRLCYRARPRGVACV